MAKKLSTRILSAGIKSRKASTKIVDTKMAAANDKTQMSAPERN